MKNSILSFLVCLFPIVLSAQQREVYVETLTGTTTLNEAVAYHLTSTTAPMSAFATVNLTHEDAWLFFDEIRPSTVISDYVSHIKINGEDLTVGTNGRVELYGHGAVVIPHASTYMPLTVYKDENFAGESTQYGVDYHKELGDFDNAIKSFKLKRGYMATLADEADGTGYSRVFIADKEDLEFSVIPKLNGRTSFIRVFRWRWPNKKGWCGGDPGAADKLNATTYYDWSATGIVATDNVEVALIRSKRSWPTLTWINAKTDATHLLGYNEPDHAEQHLDDNGGSAISVELALSSWEEHMKSGLRLGSPAPTDFGWLYQFIDSVDARNLRCDYVAIHCYWGGKSPQNWYNDLKYVHERTGRNIWITEWNNGANWTSEYWPGGRVDGTGAPINNATNFQNNLDDIKAILNVLDTASFVERYYIYNWVQDVRAVILSDTLTPTGEYYNTTKPRLAYVPELEYVPTFHLHAPAMRTASFDVRTGVAKIVWSNPNSVSETSKITLERSKDDGAYETIYETTNGATIQYSDSSVQMLPGVYKYRIKIESDMDPDNIVYSDNLPVCLAVSSNVGDMRYGTGTHASRDLCYYQYAEPFGTGTRIVICGTATNNNLFGMNAQLKSESTAGFSAEMQSWYTQLSTTYSRNEDVPFMALLAGNGTIGELKYEAGRVSAVAQNTAKQVTFSVPFTSTPVVFVRATTLYNGYPIIARVNNVTPEGFDVTVTTEDGTTVTTNIVSYIAIEQGKTSYNGKKIAVASGLHTSSISFDETYYNPFFYIGMQTRNDERTSMLRYRNLTETGVTITKNTATTPAGTTQVETNGWIVIGNSETGIQELQKQDNVNVYALHKRIVVVGTDDYSIYSITGLQVGKNIDLPSGIYMVKVANGSTHKVIVN